MRTMTHEAAPALVVSVGKNAAWVVIDGEREPRLAALRRTSGKRAMPVPGDAVAVRLLEDGSTVVERMEPRSNSLQRRTARGRSKVMAANIDTLVTVTSLAHPPPRLVTLDQLLAFSALEELAALIVFTKPDLADAATRKDLERLYTDLGYPVVTMNPKLGENLEAFRHATDGHRALISGVSGVGKSTIFAALGGSAEVGPTSRFGLGRQTTTAAKLHRTANGFLIDSPGINEFGLGRIEPAELAEAFLEIAALRGRCRFTDCTHLAEPGCAVREAVAAGSIATSRYESYTSILKRVAP